MTPPRHNIIPNETRGRQAFRAGGKHRLTPTERDAMRIIIADMGYQRASKALGVSVPVIQELENEFGAVSLPALDRCRAGLARVGAK